MIAIVTDSTSDLTPELREQYGIRVVPLSVLFGDRVYQDGSEITPAQLFKGVREGKKTPSTSQPSPEAFSAAYKEALQSADQVLSLHISGELSGTVGSARLAAQDFGGKVTVVDTHSASMGLGLLVLRAARRAAEGVAVADIVAELERIQPLQDIRFLVDTLDFLRINGRIGGAAAFLGGLLNIKPILALSNGKVQAAGRVRGHKKAVQEVVDHIRSYLARTPQTRLAFMITEGGEGTYQEIRAGIAGLPFEDAGVSNLGAVVATHAGPGTVGVVMEPLSA